MVLSELSFPFGRLDPSDHRTRSALHAIEVLISAIPEDRVMLPSAESKIRGAILAGAMVRVLGLGAVDRRRVLMDAMLAAQAARENLLLVTRNVVDFDRLSQMDAKLKVAFYRI